MATSDLHMQVTDFDYVRDKAGQGGSLAKIATLIAALRNEALQTNRTPLLFDNGDTYQGSPIADVLAENGTDEKHPMAAIMDLLQYDACGLGNHDFDYGLDYLGTCLSQLQAPVVCSNMITALLPTLQSGCILEREVATDEGKKFDLRIGVVSSVPDRTALWSRFHLESRATLRPPVPALRETAADLKAAGADIVIALAHMGIAPFDEGPDAQNLIQDVAQIEDIDVLIGGHTHLRFPGLDHSEMDDVDTVSGTVHGKPLVQPGAAGADLGVIDLTLSRPDPSSTWNVSADKVKLIPANGIAEADTHVRDIAAPSHHRARTYLSERVGRIARPMHSFFALADPSPLPALLAEAKSLAVREAISDTGYGDLPLLAASSAPLTGGLDGPDNFLHLKAGNLERRHIRGMSPYANNVWAVKTTGAQIMDWLERAALIFNRLSPDRPDQLLIDPRVPGFQFDTIYGLSYSIDPRAAARFDVAGRPQGGEGRIRDVRWQGRAIDPQQEFLVATTDHRAGGGGLYKPFPNADIVFQGASPLQEAVLRYMDRADCQVIRNAKPWRFSPAIDCQAVLLTSPHATDYLDDIAHLAPDIQGENEDGFLRIRVHL